MLCDVCNSTVPPEAGERITPEVFTYLLDNGFGLDETNIKMLTDAGMPRSAAETALKKQYQGGKAEWLICPQCAAKAMAIMAHRSESWVSDGYLAVTSTAEEVGLGFDVLGAPVALSRAVWTECVEWTDEDSERQTYQEQDSRLWDVMFTGGGSLQLKVNQFLRDQLHQYSVQCIPRDGASTDAVEFKLLIRQTVIRGQYWLTIEKTG
jgi:hypothetical protein